MASSFLQLTCIGAGNCMYFYNFLLSKELMLHRRAKYPIAIVHELLEHLGKDLGVGYDVGCKFSRTILRTALKDCATALRYQSLIGLFHGHAHNCLCQLQNLGTYVEGQGLEDLETCERFFSKTNDLAPTIRYASTFHRRQALANYFEHLDRHDTYENLSECCTPSLTICPLTVPYPGKFLADNYNQALAILAEEAPVEHLMEELGVDDGSTFEQWLREEEEYLQSLKQEPVEETLQIEYVKKLVAMHDAQ
jgi:hypothetical protein